MHHDQDCLVEPVSWHRLYVHIALLRARLAFALEVLVLSMCVGLLGVLIYLGNGSCVGASEWVAQAAAWIRCFVVVGVFERACASHLCILGVIHSNMNRLPRIKAVSPAPQVY